ncbi:MAG: 2-polyprenylphenol hydroxylase [Myxococcaceae bacterium]|nr:2-polyprenylphenol hydroxylase [Myxococcaceae bacterium]
MSSSELRVRIASIRALSPSVRSLSLSILRSGASESASEQLEPPLGGPAGLPAFLAGQWLHLHVQTALGEREKRAYSIASAPGVQPIELAITHVRDGVVSPVLHALREGDELGCDGPYGFFTREGELRAAPALFVGTGTGLSPLRSMLFDVLAAREHPPVTLLLGVRTAADILWRDELEAWAARDSRFRFEVTLSRPDSAWQGRKGYVQAHVAELARALGEPHVFICGLSPMVSDVRALCKAELGYDRKRIHSERYD